MARVGAIATNGTSIVVGGVHACASVGDGTRARVGARPGNRISAVVEVGVDTSVNTQNQPRVSYLDALSSIFSSIPIVQPTMKDHDTL